MLLRCDEGCSLFAVTCAVEEAPACTMKEYGSEAPMQHGELLPKKAWLASLEEACETATRSENCHRVLASSFGAFAE